MTGSPLESFTVPEWLELLYTTCGAGAALASNPALPSKHIATAAAATNLHEVNFFVQQICLYLIQIKHSFILVHRCLKRFLSHKISVIFQYLQEL